MLKYNQRLFAMIFRTNKLFAPCRYDEDPPPPPKTDKELKMEDDFNKTRRIYQKFCLNNVLQPISIALRNGDYEEKLCEIRSHIIKEVLDNKIIKTLPRETLWLAQTPQGFRRDIILDALKSARDDGYLGTDDASLVERMGVDVSIVRW